MPWQYNSIDDLADKTNPDAPLVEKIVDSAVIWLKAFTGRDHLSFSQQAPVDAVRAAAWVLYNQILVADPPINFDPLPHFSNQSQQFRTLGEIELDNQANCLEMALLFASCALRAQLKPTLIFLDAGETDHALIGLRLPDCGDKRERIVENDDPIKVSELGQLIGSGRFSTATEYWNNFFELDLLVLDCSGAALGYPSSTAPTGLNFETAVKNAWTRLTTSKVCSIIDLCQAKQDMPFPERPRPHVIGRETELQSIDTELVENNLVVAGSFGVGKTALALEYAFRHKQDYPWGIFLLNATDRGRALEQLVDFARQKLIKTTEPSTGTETTQEGIVLASNWVHAINQATEKALLIVDDVADATFVNQPIADCLRLSELNCRLLVTTRDEGLLAESSDFENLVLSPLEDEDATTMLLSMLPQDRRDKTAAGHVCQLLKNLPLLIRIAGLTVAGDESLTLHGYAERIDAGFLPANESTTLPDYPEPISAVLDSAWRGLDERVAGPRDVLKLLSILPRNESIPFELLALMLDLSDDKDESNRIERVRQASGELSATGLAEKPEDNAVRIHPVMHEFATIKAGDDPGFITQALKMTKDQLHQPDFFRNHEQNDLIRRIQQLSLLRKPSRLNPRLEQIVRIFEVQLDYLRQGYDALPQLAMQARLAKADELADVLEKIRTDIKGPWFRLRWHGRHESDYEQKTGGHSDAVSAVAIWPESPDKIGSQIAISGAENGELIQWSLDPFKSTRPLPCIRASISSLCISPNGKTVYASARDGSLSALILDQDNQREAHVMGRHASPANDCAIDPDGRFVVSVSDDGTARVYILSEGIVKALKHPEDSALLKCAVACEPKTLSSILVTASRAGIVRAWNPLTGAIIGTELDLGQDSGMQTVSACALSPDGRLAAIATHREVLLWKPGSKKIMSQVIGERYVTDCSFSPDGKRLLLVGRSKRASIYNMEEQAMECRLEPYYHWLTACSFGANQRLLFASDDGSVHTLTYDSRPGHSFELKSVPGRPNWVNVFRAGKESALSVSTERTICRWNLSTGVYNVLVRGEANWVNAFALSPDGEHVLSGTDSGDVKYWSFKNSTTVSLTGFTQRVNACAISADGKKGLAGSEDCTLRSWSLVGNLEQLNHFTDQHRAAVKACAISENGKLALSGGDDARAVLWNFADGTCKRVFKGHKARITAVDFAPDQPDIVLTASWDHSIKCWNTESGERIKNYDGHTDSVTSCGAAKNGLVFSVSLDRTLQRWQLTGDDPAVVIHLGHRLRGLVVDPSGEMVICSGMTGTVFLFDIEPGLRDDS